MHLSWPAWCAACYWSRQYERLSLLPQRGARKWQELGGALRHPPAAERVQMAVYKQLIVRALNAPAVQHLVTAIRLLLRPCGAAIATNRPQVAAQHLHAQVARSSALLHSQALALWRP